MKVYLSGAIEHAEDGGRGWREAITELLREELHHEVYDPAADQKKDLTDEELANFRRWKLQDPARFREVVRKIIAWDLGRIETQTEENRSSVQIACMITANLRATATAARLKPTFSARRIYTVCTTSRVSSTFKLIFTTASDV